MLAAPQKPHNLLTEKMTTTHTKTVHAKPSKLVIAFVISRKFKKQR
jgi:hypothetical protein